MAEAETDDWAPVAQAQKAPDDDWQPVGAAQPAGDSFDDRFTGEQLIPEPFLKRLLAGRNMDTQMKRAVQDFDALKEGFGSEPLGWSNEHVKELMDMGMLHDPARGTPGPLRLLSDSLTYGVPKVLDAALRGVNAGLHFSASVASHVAEDLPGGTENDAQRLKRELTNFGNYLMVDGMAKFGRSHPSGEQVVGTLPRDADFKTAAEVGKLNEVKLREAWEEKGIHPAEAVHDAQTDTFLRHDLSSAAAEPDLPPVTPITAAAPAPLAGRLAAAARETADSLFDIGRDIQMNLTPMATGTTESMAIAKDFANTMRRNRWEWSRIDEDVAKRFTPEQRTRMWNAADEESVARQLGEIASPPAPGMVRLYRGETDMPKTPVADWVKESPEYQATVDATGRWFVKDRATAEYYNESFGDKTGRVSYVDVPTEKVESYLSSNQPSAKKFSAAGREAQEYFIPKDIAEQRKPFKNSEHQGLVTLDPAERAAVEDLQTRAQNAWVRARDLDMVEGEGLPAYTPRMLMNVATGSDRGGPIPLNGMGLNLRTKTGQLKHRDYMTAEETEAAAKRLVGMRAALGLKSIEEIEGAVDAVHIARDIRALPLATAILEDAIAGRTLIKNIEQYGKSTGIESVVDGGIPAGSETKWFTMDHPAFRKWRPQMKEIDGKVQVVKDAEGNTMFESVPIYVDADFEGPLRAVLTQRSGPLYSSMMSLKGKTMGLIMNSPAIHNMVEFGRAFPAMPTRIVKAYFDGNRAKNDPAVMREAIDAGLVPIGKRFFNQDITSVMESPDLTPGRSWTSKVLAAVPGLFDEAAGVAVKRAIDKAGDFWHNTLLWDRIADLQMGLYVNLRGDLLRKGVDPQTSSRMAAHFANRYAGALPQEAMSQGAAKVANFMLFSRSFTLGNLGVMKDMFTGLPKDVMAQITRDMGTVDPAAAGYAKSLARRKAIAAVTLDIGLLYVGNSVLQSALNVMLGDSTIDQESHGYAKRAKEVLNSVQAHPLEMLQPFDLVERLSATADNEPSKKDRLKIGYSKDGTAIYARNPVGKIGEEFVGYAFSPIDMLKKKQGTIARPMLQVINNDKGFGRKIYDTSADTPVKYAGNIWAIVEHIAKAQTPEGQITAAADLVKGDGDPKVNAMQALGPIAGVTFSKGAPGGPAVGEMYAARAQHRFQVDMAMPDIRKQIARGDLAGAQQAMTGLAIPPALQRFYIRTSLNPSTRLSSKALRDFYMTATPAQRERMERIRSPQEGSPLSP